MCAGRRLISIVYPIDLPIRYFQVEVYIYKRRAGVLSVVRVLTVLECQLSTCIYVVHMLIDTLVIVCFLFFRMS